MEELEFWAFVLGCLNATAALYIWTKQRKLTQSQIALQAAQTELQRDQTAMQRVQTDLQAVQTALQQRANELQEAQDKLARKQLDSMSADEVARSKARIDLKYWVSAGDGHLALKNSGQGAATKIHVQCLTSEGFHNPLDDRDVASLSEEEVRPGASRQLRVSVALESTQDNFELSWTNPDGTRDRLVKTIRY